MGFTLNFPWVAYIGINSPLGSARIVVVSSLSQSQLHSNSYSVTTSYNMLLDAWGPISHLYCCYCNMWSVYCVYSFKG